MHKVFIDDKELIFENIYSQLNVDSNKKISILSDAEFSLNDVLAEMKKDVEGVIYLCSNPDQAWTQFTGMYILMEAAGGIVKNDSDEVLVIFRKKKWDLPKGKLDYQETPEEAAIREVKEECGIKNLELEKFLLKTFHTYNEKNKYILKKTHWYKMTSFKNEKLIPQIEEEIEEVKWMNRDKIYKKVFEKTYSSIKEVLTKYFEEENKMISP